MKNKEIVKQIIHSFLDTDTEKALLRLTGVYIAYLKADAKVEIELSKAMSFIQWFSLTHE